MVAGLGFSKRKESPMGRSAKRVGIAVAAVSALAGGTVGLADAASSASHAQGTRGPGNPAETVLTGSALQSASTAALAAVPGGTVQRASIEDPGDASKAAYEVHVAKADGSEAQVLEDASFKVLSATAGPGPGRGHDHGPGGPGEPGGPGGPDGHRGPGGGNPNEAALTGATLSSARAAAVAAVPGATVERATAEDKGEKSGAAYEVHVTKADGTEATVLEDAAFKVLSVTAGGPGHGPGGPGGPDGRGGPGPGGPPMFGVH